MTCKYRGGRHTNQVRLGVPLTSYHCTHPNIAVPFCVKLQTEKDAMRGGNCSVCQGCPLYDGPYGNCTWKSTDGIVWDSVPITPCLHGTCNEPAFDPDEPGQEAIVSCAPMEQP